MSYLKQAAALLCLSVSAAHADPTMTDLQGSAQTILNQLNAAQSLTAGATYSASNGDILEPGIMQDATVTEQMWLDYNSDIQGVIDATYYNAEMLFQDQYAATMVNLDSAVDNLVAATAVLMEVQAVANMAANADTVQEQMAVQAVLTNNDMTVSAADVSNYNNALGAVQSYARDAGAFLAASRNTTMTGTVDAYAASSGTNLYGATVAYSPTFDIMNISAANVFGIGLQGLLGADTVTLADVYAAGYGS
jgi:phosphoribosylformylglycinamidine (FGAM) synthase-like enzyme